MKKVIMIAVVALSMSSCMINTHVVGTGGSDTEFARKNTVYVLGNRVSEVDSKALAGGAENYIIDTRSNLTSSIVAFFTLGIVTTRTVIIRK